MGESFVDNVLETSCNLARNKQSETLTQNEIDLAICKYSSNYRQGLSDL
jgi:hypothetical protein